MPIDGRERLKEQAWLEIILQTVKEQLNIAGGDLSKFTKETIETRRLIWENYTHHIRTFDDAIELNPHLDEMRRQESRQYFYQKMLHKLKKMVLAPYFGRIDFRESNASSLEKIYIGIASLFDQESGQNLIYDWRAPIAGMFYDFELGPANYQCGIGRIDGQIILKRQYRIADGQIQLMFDTDLRIEDEMLQEILGRSADERMKTIVNSIQREQNKVIRDEEHQLLIVVGPAGSGKTSIALHRAAYLLYKERESIKAENILVFSPNWIFSEYISNVLPELGEENIIQTTFQDYARKILKQSCEERNQQLEFLLSGNGGTECRIREVNIHYKCSSAFVNVLENYLHLLEEREFEDLYFNGRLVMSKEECCEIYYKKYSFFPITKRLMMVRERFFYLLEPLRRKRAKEMEKILADEDEYGDKYLNEKELKAFARIKVREEAEAISNKIHHLTRLDYFEVYLKLFLDKNLFKKVAAGTEIPSDFNLISNQTSGHLAQSRINYEDVAPLLYLKGKLEGFPIMKKIRYLFIDEAQDYTPLQYQLIKNLFPGISITVLGDLNQLVNPYLTIDSIETIVKIFDYPSSISIRLTKSYRSTREINNFAQALLPKTDWVGDEDGIRLGRKPELIKVLPETMIDVLAHYITQLKADGIKSIAIICKTARTAKTIYSTLSRKIDLNLIIDEDGVLGNLPVIIPIYLAKGLEFDAALIPDASLDNYYREWDRKILYTACTRALHRLVLFYETILSPLVDEISRDLYELKEF